MYPSSSELQQNVAVSTTPPPPRTASLHRPSGARVPYFDAVTVHRDLAAYYRSFGLFDTSTPSELFERVVWPNHRPTP
jgi:hypothetical protein